MWDAIVLGAGPNGLVAAVTLARRGWSVLVLEAQARPGGAVWSEALTLPGFLHDVGAAFFPFAAHSPALRSLELEGTGLTWLRGPRDSAHPGPDGTCPTIGADVECAARTFGADADAWRNLANWASAMDDRLVAALLATLPAIPQAWNLGPRHLFRLGLLGLRSTAGASARLFQTEAARRVLPGLALHVDLGPDDWTGAGLGLVLALQASLAGFRVPRGGARAITEALLLRLAQAGGTLELNTPVRRVVTRRRRAVAVRTAAGVEYAARHAILADLGPPALFLRMLDPQALPAWFRGSIRRFRYGWGTFKMDWALAERVPWLAAEARASAVVHAGDSLADLRHFTQTVRRGQIPEHPYLVLGQQSLFDPLRAPPGQQTLWAYSRVPTRVEGGWIRHRDAFADRIEERIERLAPGFRTRILGRAIHAPDDLERMDENLVGGDLGGGSARLDQQLFFRPAFPYFRYRTPIQGLYLCSASAPPGAGVHGACGWNAALAALSDSGVE